MSSPIPLLHLVSTAIGGLSRRSWYRPAAQVPRPDSPLPGGGRPILAALNGWVIGCLLGALTSGCFALTVDPVVALLPLSSVPVWLLAWLFYRTGAAAGPTATRGLEDTSPRMDG